MKIKMINKSNNENPKYSREGDSGMDLRAFIPSRITLLPHRQMLISTGIHIELVEGLEGQVRGRSGLALKYGVGVAQGLGTVDSNYRGDIGVVLINNGNSPFHIENGDRIAQLVIAKVETVELEIVKKLEETNRGEKGFGSSGVK